MDCRAVQARLISFHFGVLGEESRTLLEAHLKGCGGCLQAHLAVKRVIEEGQRAQASARPGGAAGPLRPLGFGLLGAALALLVAACLGLLRPAPAAPVLAAPASVPLPRASCPAPSAAAPTFI